MYPYMITSSLYSSTTLEAGARAYSISEAGSDARPSACPCGLLAADADVASGDVGREPKTDEEEVDRQAWSIGTLASACRRSSTLRPGSTRVA
jgi:hypothetical protein